MVLICRHVKLNFAIEPALRCFLNWVTEELKNPYVNLPRAIIIGCSVVTLFYVAVNVAYLTALSPQSIIQSSAVSVDVANYLLGPPIAFIIPITVACSTFRRVSFWFIHNWQVHSFNFNSTSSILFIFYLRLHRICFARQGHTVEILSYIHVDSRIPFRLSRVTFELFQAFRLHPSSVHPSVGNGKIVQTPFLWINAERNSTSLPAGRIIFPPFPGHLLVQFLSHFIYTGCDTLNY